MKFRRNYKLEKIEGVDMIELEPGDKFFIKTPSTSEGQMMKGRIDNCGILVIESEKRNIKIKY